MKLPKTIEKQILTIYNNIIKNFFIIFSFWSGQSELNRHFQDGTLMFYQLNYARLVDLGGVEPLSQFPCKRNPQSRCPSPWYSVEDLNLCSSDINRFSCHWKNRALYQLSERWDLNPHVLGSRPSRITRFPAHSDT